MSENLHLLWSIQDWCQTCVLLLTSTIMSVLSHRETVNAWFSERVHSIQPSASKENPAVSSASAAPPPTLTLPDTCCPSSPAPSPAPGTPTRKISASEFDRPLRPIVVKGAEGSLTFLSDGERGAVPVRVMGEGGGVHVGGCIGAGGSCGRERCARLLELVKEVSSHLDVTALCHKIFLHINELIAADRYSLFLVGKRPDHPASTASANTGASPRASLA